MDLIELNEINGNNNYYIINTENNEKYGVMHIVNGKFAIYDFEYHNIIIKFKWHPNNGYACCLLKDEHFELLPDLPFEKNKLIYMHLLIQEYCLKIEKPDDRHVLHHINERRRDNRKQNMIWVTKNQQRALLKVIGKLAKPPVEIRPIMPYLPKHCKWINAKKSFWIDSHPACFLAVENKEIKHKYIESLKGKKWTIQQKFDDFIKKYEALMNKPYGGKENYYKFLEFKKELEISNKLIVEFVTAKAIACNADANANADTAEIAAITNAIDEAKLEDDDNLSDSGNSEISGSECSSCAGAE
jgi:hypothetical protein